MTSKPLLLISSSDSTATLYFMMSDIFTKKQNMAQSYGSFSQITYLFMEDWMVIQQIIIFFESAVNKCPEGY